MRRLDSPHGLALLLVLCVAPPSLSEGGVSRDDEFSDGLVADVAQLIQPSNQDRLNALLALLQQRRLKFETQPFRSEKQEGEAPAEGKNVVLSFGSGDRALVVGAHFDAARMPGGQLSAGVVDNAASVVILTRVAEALTRLTLRHQVKVVMFDMEEAGLVGSKHFVASLDASRVAAMINLDVAAYGDTLIFGPADHPGNQTVYAALREVCAEHDFSCLAFPKFPVGDDRSFQAAGVPNVSLAVLPGLEAHQLWLLLNGGQESGLREGFLPAILRTIHQPEDTISKLDPKGMTLAFQSVLRLVTLLDSTLN
ncbi:MAG: M28 family peptidase [Acidobacteriota bacterium]